MAGSGWWSRQSSSNGARNTVWPELEEMCPGGMREERICLKRKATEIDGEAW